MSLFLKMLPFALVAIALTVGIHYFLYIRLGRDPAWPAPWPSVIKITLIAIASMIPLTMMFGRWLPRSISDPLAWPVFLWMAVMLYLLLGLVATEPIRLLVRFAGVDEERRQLLS